MTNAPSIPAGQVGSKLFYFRDRSHYEQCRYGDSKPYEAVVTKVGHDGLLDIHLGNDSHFGYKLMVSLVKEGDKQPTGGGFLTAAAPKVIQRPAPSPEPKVAEAEAPKAGE